MKKIKYPGLTQEDLDQLQATYDVERRRVRGKQAYAIVDYNGRLLISTIYSKRGDTIRCFEKGRSYWSRLRKLGYTCQKVIITVKK